MVDRARIAVLIPCLNEEAAIDKVVRDFRVALPRASIYVYDNGSDDDTVSVARAAGARVRTEWQRGKGNVVRRMFADIEADIYVLVDGDDTYDATVAPAMVDRLLGEGLDMVSVARDGAADAAYRPGHRFGNVLLSSLVVFLFRRGLDDMLSGYRFLTRRFVKSFPITSSGFEIETELSVHALELRLPISECRAPYRERASGSTSKLRTLRDGWKILRMILRLIKDERPLTFFGIAAVAAMLLSIGLATPLVIEYLETGLVPRFPTGILATGIMLLGFLSLFSGLILDTVTRGRQEVKRLHYLAIDPYVADSGHDTEASMTSGGQPQ